VAHVICSGRPRCRIGIIEMTRSRTFGLMPATLRLSQNTGATPATRDGYQGFRPAKFTQTSQLQRGCELGHPQSKF
jgi:hypothetical protein